MRSIPTIKGLADIINQYDFFILDQWGVMHNGKKGYNQAIKSVEKLYQEKKEIIIVTKISKIFQLSNSQTSFTFLYFFIISKNCLNSVFSSISFNFFTTKSRLFWNADFIIWI